MALVRVLQKLLYPAGRNLGQFPREIQIFFKDVVDQFLELVGGINDNNTQIEEWISNVSAGLIYRTYYEEITNTGVTRITIKDDEGNPDPYEYATPLVFVDKRLQGRRDYMKNMNTSGDYVYIDFDDPLPYDIEKTPPGPIIQIVYIKKQDIAP